MGKGSLRRPMVVTAREFELAWERLFGKRVTVVEHEVVFDTPKPPEPLAETEEPA